MGGALNHAMSRKKLLKEIHSSTIPNRKSPLSLLPRASDKQTHSSKEREASEDRREWYLLLSVSRGMDRPHVKDLLSMGVSDALIGEGQRTQNHQQNPRQKDWFHIVACAIRWRAFDPE